MTQVSFKSVISTLTTIILAGLELIWQQVPSGAQSLISTVATSFLLSLNFQF